MTSDRTIAGFALALLLAGSAATAQTIYEKQGKEGPVFSDQPSAGSAVVNLPPPNVIEGPKVKPATPAVSSGQPQAPRYEQLVVASPASKGTVHTNTGAFTVKARVQPALRKGDRIRVRLDGNWLPGRYQKTQIAITAADWAGAARDDNVEHTLQLAIEDKAGQLLMESATSNFFAHRATVGGKAK